MRHGTRHAETVDEKTGRFHSFAVQRFGGNDARMKLKAAIPALLMLFAATPAKADNCPQVAQDLAAQYGAEVLAARAEGGSCVVKLRIPGQGGQPPRIETFTVPG
jgi:hypothetical protein